ncbi:prophage protein [Streptococcus varani]|uniref:Prophage protein n=1 Tax=Streptococcus varani TaxID=1608583 RepID=A0A0E4CSI2_9STRE|nr:hypothetical protein [Streptococcus varani]CQR24570.1 prophage protein [Streptococcus varani]
MTLVVKKTTRLVGELTVDGTVVKTITVELDDKAMPTVTEWTNDEALYAAHRKEMRKQKKEFDDKRFALEDAILAELEAVED